jgi:hypothetical protein
VFKSRVEHYLQALKCLSEQCYYVYQVNDSRVQLASMMRLTFAVLKMIHEIAQGVELCVLAAFRGALVGLATPVFVLRAPDMGHQLILSPESLWA